MRWMMRLVSLFLLQLAVAEWQPNVEKHTTNMAYNIQPFDDSTRMLRQDGNVLALSKDNGRTWNEIDITNQNISHFMIDDNYPAKRAFAYAQGGHNIYKTEDQGDSWSELDIPLPNKGSEENENNFMYCYVNSHPQFENDLIAQCNVCTGRNRCEDLKYLSKNGKDFSELTIPQPPDDNGYHYSFCQFFRNHKSSKLGGDHEAICSTVTISNIKEGEMMSVSSSIITTNDYGKSVKVVDNFKGMTPVTMNIIGDYCVVVTMEDKFNRESVRRVWVSQDGSNFEEAYFPTQVRSDLSFQQLGSSREKLVASISSPEKQFQGIDLLLSDSTGLKFTLISSLLSDDAGFYFMQPVDELEGTVISTFTAFVGEGSSMKSTIKTRISFDDGTTWSYLKLDDVNNEFTCNVNDPESCSIRTFWFNSGASGNIVPTPTTAGILALSGVVGDSYDFDWNAQKTFISRNGGALWRKILDFPAAVAFGDLGNIMVAVPYNADADGDPAGEFYFSLDQGETWTEHQLDEEFYLDSISSTALDGSGSTFVLLGSKFDGRGKNAEPQSFTYTIDFSSAFDGKKCGEQDIEDWYLNEGKCVKGAKRKFRRRKADAQCLVSKLYENAKIIGESCSCTDADYECASEFSPDGNGNCIIDHTLLQRSDVCKGRKSSVKLPAKQLQRGDICEKPLTINPIEVTCDNDKNKGNLQGVTVVENELRFRIKSYQYFDTIGDETLIVRSDKHEVYLSHDNGQTFRKLNLDDTIIEVVFNPYFNTTAYLFGKSGKLYITNDRARSFTAVELPHARQLGFPLSFHAKDPKSFIFYGGQGCETLFDPNCHAVAYITRDGGITFEELAQGAVSCDFVGSTYEIPSNADMIMCEIKEKGTNKRSLLTTTDFFQNDKNTVFEEIVGYVTTGEYTVIAVPHNSDELRAYVTIDGKEFAEANFPTELSPQKQQAYTVLGSQQGAIFFHLTTSTANNREFGALMKSNSNGTSFVVLERAVNRSPQGFVDFEKLEGLEGIILANTVSNAEKVKEGSQDKQLRTKITFNDGADWSYLAPPTRDSKGKGYSCKTRSLETCSLNLHGYTERRDVRDTYSSGSALGYMIGVGNVGDHLLPLDECSTFMSTDGGISWKEIKDTPHQWEYGDHGSVIVLVPNGVKTDTVSYSTDSGKTWEDFKFTDEEVLIDDIVTVPQDSAMRFMMIGTSSSVKGQQQMTFTLDFSRCFKRQCVLDFENERNDDYDYVSIKNQDSKCLFGHEAEYLKKINDDCYNGAAPLNEMFKILKNCSCTRNDFECDYNYYKANDGTCKLTEGLDPADPNDMCKKTDAVLYFKPTGYRRIPMSTCKGGMELDKATVPKACPGKEKEFRELYKVSRTTVVFVIILPLLIFILVAWFVYDRGIRRNGGFARFGEIRLGDDELIEENETDRAVNTIVKFGVFAFSGMVASVQFVKRASKSTFGRLRSIFSRNRAGPSYSSLTHDQFLDEADELLDGHDEDANDLASFMENEDSYEVDTEEEQGSSTHEPYSDHDAGSNETDNHNQSEI